MGRAAHNGQSDSLRVGGRYRLAEKLGSGGMSVVWRGHDDVLGRHVAVKVLSPKLAGDQVFRDRLRQEALAAARLVHPHITAIFDFGECPIEGDITVPYVVMELNDGESVAARLIRRGSLPWREAVTIAVEVASALATAHARGLVHRDVTPANVMLTGAGAKVVDFGISAAVGQRDAAPDGSLLGTPAYLAPERLAGSQVTAATDVYALGLLLYRALAGTLPWPAETTAEALRAHLYADPAPLPEIAGMPSTVSELCLRCLSKNPADRPVAAEVARSMGAVVGLQPVIPPLAAREPSPIPARGAASPVAPSGASPAQARGGLRDAALACLAFPGTPVSASTRVFAGTGGGRRLRAGLRIGLGTVRPLGGGLFAGVGGRRVSAVVITAAVLATVGAALATGRDTEPVERAQTATTGRATAIAASPACVVRYQLRRDSGSDYEALLTVALTDAAAGGPWRVQFLYPGTQHLTGLPPAIAQKGRRVVVHGNGKAQAFTLRGDYRGVNALPVAFTLDGHRCRAEVVGSLTAAPGDSLFGADSPLNESATSDNGSVSEAAGSEKHEPTRGQGGGGPARNPRKRTPRPRHHTTSKAPARIPAGRKSAGFSLAM